MKHNYNKIIAFALPPLMTALPLLFSAQVAQAGCPQVTTATEVTYTCTGTETSNTAPTATIVIPTFINATDWNLGNYYLYLYARNTAADFDKKAPITFTGTRITTGGNATNEIIRLQGTSDITATLTDSNIVGTRGIFLETKGAGILSTTLNNSSITTASGVAIKLLAAKTDVSGAEINLDITGGAIQTTAGDAITLRIGSGAAGGIGGNISVITKDATIKADGTAIYASNDGTTGDIYIDNDSAINTSTLFFAKGLAAFSRANTGVTTIINKKAITTLGEEAAGISAIGVGVRTEITNSGALSTSGNKSHGILAQTVGGNITVDNNANISIHGATGADGILALKTGAGNISVTNSGTIQHDVAGNYQYGIEARAGNDTTTVINQNGIITGSQFGIVAWNNLAPMTGAKSTVNIGASGVVKAIYGVSMDMSDANTLNIAQGGLIDTRAQAIQFRTRGASTPLDTVNNSGTITSDVDKVLVTDLVTAGATINFNNKAAGLMTGYMKTTNANVTVNNDGMWNLRNFADSNGDGVRDTLAVAVSDFGTSGNNVINNNGTIALLGKGNGAVTTLDTTGMYLPNGYSFNAMSTSSPVQGQLLGVKTFTNSGVIDLTANVENGSSVVGDVLVISGGHTAGADGGGVFIANGGTLKLNTVLNEGGANSQSDILVVDSTRLGSSSTLISITQTGGSGANTVGNGITLVEVLNKSASVDGVFMLGAPVTSGAYEYKLFHNGVGADANDGNWYLRSTYILPPPPLSPTCDVSNTCDPQRPVPIINSEVAIIGSEVAIIRPEVPVSMVIPSLALEYGYAMLDTLHERVGETNLHNIGPATEERMVRCNDASRNFKCVVRVQTATANGAAKDETRWASSGWARLMGDRGLHQPDNFQRRGPNYDYTFGGIQAGLDIYANEQSDGTLDKAGLYVGYGQITSNVKGQFGAKAGTVDMDAYTLAAYWTHHSPQGWYTDAVVQGTWYSANAKSVYGTSLKPDGFGLLGSLEGGYAFKLNNGWTIEPQAQVVYQSVSFDNTHLNDAFVRFDSSDSLRARLGVRVTKSWNMAEQGKEPRLVSAWLRANVWHEFLGKATTAWGSVDGQNMTPFNSYLGGTWGELGAGVTAQVSDKVNLFATGAYNRSLDNNGREGWDGRLGMTVRW